MTIATTYFKFEHIVLDIFMEGTVSQVFDIIYVLDFISYNVEY